MNDVIPDDTTGFWAIYDEATSCLQENSVEFLVTGGIAASAFGRLLWNPKSEDLGLLIPKEEADQALDALDAEGFRIERTHPDWIFKAFRGDLTIDLIFRTPPLEVSEEVFARGRRVEFERRSLPMISPEDLVLSMLAGFREETPDYWRNSLAVIAHNDLDWNYALERGSPIIHRLLSLLVYAESVDLVTPPNVARRLLEDISA